VECTLSYSVVRVPLTGQLAIMHRTTNANSMELFIIDLAFLGRVCLPLPKRTGMSLLLVCSVLLFSFLRRRTNRMSMEGEKNEKENKNEREEKRREEKRREVGLKRFDAPNSGSQFDKCLYSIWYHPSIKSLFNHGNIHGIKPTELAVYSVVLVSNKQTNQSKRRIYVLPARKSNCVHTNRHRSSIIEHHRS